MKANYLNLTVFFISFLFFQVSVAQGACYPETEFVRTEAPGDYHRIHPSGDFVLYTNPTGARAEIIDLRAKDSAGKIIPQTIRTRMTNETYPVEGSWDLLTAPKSL